MRSVAIYLLRPRKHARMRRLYRAFIEPGTLVFDIGAHVGDRTRIFAALGARVVALEPNPSLVPFLERTVGRRSGVTVVAAAVGARPGSATLHIARTNPTLSTVSADWARRMAELPAWGGYRADSQVRVPVTTLDALIERFGVPAFVKIDVEGTEDEVVAGLSQPIAALSFEAIPDRPEAALRTLERLESLGAYRYAFSVGESLRIEAWRNGDAMRRRILALPAGTIPGDVYVVSEEVYRNVLRNTHELLMPS